VTSFKKGAFHLIWQLNARVVPMVVYGAYDLYPPEKWMTMPGRVYVRYLRPIDIDSEVEASENNPTAAKESREKLSNQVRKEMLTATRDSPADTGMELSWGERLLQLTAMMGVFVFDYFFVCFAGYVLFDYLEYTVTESVLVVLGGSIAVTVVLFLYVYYLVPLMAFQKRKKIARRLKKEEEENKKED
jgi:hypothetical protein